MSKELTVGMVKSELDKTIKETYKQALFSLSDNHFLTFFRKYETLQDFRISVFGTKLYF